MSQSGSFFSGTTPPPGVAETLTGNSGGAVGPDGSNNINVLGTGFVDVTGNPGTNTLTISISGALAEDFVTDSGTATVSGNTLNVLGGENINTEGAGNTVTVNLNRTIEWPNTNAAGTEGVIYLNSQRFLHNYDLSGIGWNVFLGSSSGNFTNIGFLASVGIGTQVLQSLTSGHAIAIGIQALRNMTSGESNISIGEFSGSALVNGDYNLLLGRSSGGSLISGSNNIAIGGTSALSALVSGNNNIVIGTQIFAPVVNRSAENYTSNETANIVINNAGVTGDNNTIRIGTTGGDAASQNRLFLAATYLVTPPSTGHRFLIQDDDEQVGTAPALTNGQLFIGSTGNNPIAATITAGSGINITNGAGSITVATTGSSGLGTTDHAVQVGTASGGLTSLGVGTTGQLLVGATGADPAFASSANGSFTFTSSTAGTNRFVKVTNTDNTNTASHGTFFAETGGASSGDPRMQFAVSGVNTFSMGIDNSDSDKFKLSYSSALGTTDAFVMTTSGEVTMPLQPAFLAYNSANDTNQTGAGAIVTVEFDTEIYDQNGDYNTTTDTFTAPVTGKYQLQTSIRLASVTAAMTTARIEIVTSNGSFRSSHINAGAAVAADGRISFECAVLADMDAMDTATVTIGLFNGAGNTATIEGTASPYVTYFSGFLAC